MDELKKELKKWIFADGKIYYKLTKEDYEDGPWLTSTQLLAWYNRKVKKGAIPRKEMHDDLWGKPYKAFYCYNLQDTEEVDDAEVERLKASFIDKYGSWGFLNYDDTTYDGKVWY